MIQFTVPGEPKGKGRPRMTKQGHAFTPKDTVNYENWVKTCFLSSQQPRFTDPDQPLCADITAYMAIPASATKKKREAMLSGLIRPTKKPDRDNIEKIVLDSLNGIAYPDDKQVTDGEFKKRYSDNPRVEITIKSAV